MHEEIAIAGTGGQGVLFAGRLLAEAALLEDREVVWMPSYGAEKRGGSVYCNIIISDERIGAMVVVRPHAAIAMNLAWTERFEPAIKPGGLLIVNKSLVPRQLKRDDIQVIYLPANDLAAELGDDSAANLIALGTLISCRPVVSPSSIYAAMDNMLAKNRKRLEFNKRALNKGLEMAPAKISPTTSSSARPHPRATSL
ncbi:MAG TPA: 2-oxoacid:ferredoxin oxidoreductase subunit gamma [Dehalococcoidia bacterium]|nr:2-oxoacid:ferredoxin oxidoreductase subunit gamma [Dehalococcoidia bacterium]